MSAEGIDCKNTGCFVCVCPLDSELILAENNEREVKLAGHVLPAVRCGR